MSPNVATEMNLSDHARRRSQQRNIPPKMLDHLFRFGTYPTAATEQNVSFSRERVGRRSLAPWEESTD